jgi:hypothetical protein
MIVGTEHQLSPRVYIQYGEHAKYLTHGFHHPETLHHVKNFVLDHLQDTVNFDDIAAIWSSPKQALFLRKALYLDAAFIWLGIALLLSIAVGAGVSVSMSVTGEGLGLGFAAGGGLFAICVSLQCLLILRGISSRL